MGSWTQAPQFPPAEVTGHYAAWSYFQSIDRPESREFVRKFADLLDLGVKHPQIQRQPAFRQLCNPGPKARRAQLSCGCLTGAEAADPGSIPLHEVANTFEPSPARGHFGIEGRTYCCT